MCSLDTFATNLLSSPYKQHRSYVSAFPTPGEGCDKGSISLFPSLPPPFLSFTHTLSVFSSCLKRLSKDSSRKLKGSQPNVIATTCGGSQIQFRSGGKVLIKVKMQQSHFLKDTVDSFLRCAKNKIHNKGSQSTSLPDNIIVIKKKTLTVHSK